MFLPPGDKIKFLSEQMVVLKFGIFILKEEGCLQREYLGRRFYEIVLTSVMGRVLWFLLRILQ